MTTIPIQEARARLLELIHQMQPGEEVLITENNQPLARLTSVKSTMAAHQRDWWTALQRIQAGQQQRGFVGEASGIDRDDQGYDERMNELYRNTVSTNRSS